MAFSQLLFTWFALIVSLSTAAVQVMQSIVCVNVYCVPFTLNKCSLKSLVMYMYILA